MSRAIARSPDAPVPVRPTPGRDDHRNHHRRREVKTFSIEKDIGKNQSLGFRRLYGSIPVTASGWTFAERVS